MTRVPERTEAAPRVDPVAAQVEQLFRRHASFVYRALCRLNVPSADVEDALQEVFMVVARKLEHYEDRGSIKAWLFAIARQVALTMRRAESRSYARKERVLVSSVIESVPSPEDQLARQQAASFVRDLLARLDPDQAMVFYLAEVEGFTVPEIAASLDLNLNTVYGRLRLARRRIEAWLEQSELDGEK